jgi:hypothetical protein
MTDKKPVLQLMALAPTPGLSPSLYSVPMPDAVRELVAELAGNLAPEWNLPLGKANGALFNATANVVSIGVVRAGAPCPVWMRALDPIDTRSVALALGTWANVYADGDLRKKAVAKELVSVLRTAFDGIEQAPEPVALIGGDGRPIEGTPVFAAVPALAAMRIAGRAIEVANGWRLVFNRVRSVSTNACEVMSDPVWHEGHPYAVTLELSLQTIPAGRAARLHVTPHIRSFISETNLDDGKAPYLPVDVRALVRDGGGEWVTVPYGYDKGDADWDEATAGLFADTHPGRPLPDLLAYLDDPAPWCSSGSRPQILSPKSTRTGAWDHAKGDDAYARIQPGLTVSDKHDLFQAVVPLLDGLAEPLPPLASTQFHSIVPVWTPGADVADRATWRRRRLASGTGLSRIRFELVGSDRNDDALMDDLERELVAFIGPEGRGEGLEIEIVRTYDPGMLKELANDGKGRLSDSDWLAQGANRIRSIQDKRPGYDVNDLTSVTACLVVLHGPDAYRKSGADPKHAVRIGLARSGCLSQFVTPDRDMEKGSEKRYKEQLKARPHRIAAAVHDLMRQLGYFDEYESKIKGMPELAPVAGVHVCSGRGKTAPRFPVAVSIDPASGRIEATGGVFKLVAPRLGETVPYWKAQLLLASLDTIPSDQSKGFRLKRLLDGISDRADVETLLMVKSYGDIRGPLWWPGVNDKLVGRETLHYGVTKDGYKSIGDLPWTSLSPNLHVLRIRSGGDGEVPDWHTFESDLSSEDKRKFASRQGVFLHEDPGVNFAYALQPRPQDKTYTSAFTQTNAAVPQQRYLTKELSEYYLLTPGTRDDFLRYVRYAEALRSRMVQLDKGDMRTDLPAPLHLAEKLADEYVWKGLRTS